MTSINLDNVITIERALLALYKKLKSDDEISLRMRLPRCNTVVISGNRLYRIGTESGERVSILYIDDDTASATISDVYGRDLCEIRFCAGHLYYDRTRYGYPESEEHLITEKLKGSNIISEHEYSYVRLIKRLVSENTRMLGERL